MIVEAQGLSLAESSASSKTSKIVSATGTAYVRKGKLKAIIRAIKRVVKKIKSLFRSRLNFPFVIKLNTKSGIPTSLAPPTTQ